MRLDGMWRKLSLVLVLFLLVGFFVIAFHHHDDDGDHPDCPICIAAHAAHSTSINTASLNINCDISELIAPETAHFFTSLFFSSLYGRAPPA
jgi:hypothetical protein